MLAVGVTRAGARAARGQDTTALLSATGNSMGVIPEALAYVHFYANHYDRVTLRPASP